jgi:hypothetical protein
MLMVLSVTDHSLSDRPLNADRRQSRKASGLRGGKPIKSAGTISRQRSWRPCGVVGAKGLCFEMGVENSLAKAPSVDSGAGRISACPSNRADAAKPNTRNAVFPRINGRLLVKGNSKFRKTDIV